MSRLKWSFKAGSMLAASPAVGPDGTIYVGCRDRRLYAVDAAGALRWTVETGGPVDAGASVGADGRVVFGSYDGVLRAADPDGAVAWSVDLGAPVMTTPCWDDDGNLWVGDDSGRLDCVSATGRVLARATVSDLLAASPVCANGEIFVADRHLFGSGGTRLDLATEPVVAAAAVGEGGVLYLGSWDGHVRAVADGAIVWEAEVEGQVYAACSVGPAGQVLAGTRTGQVVAFSPHGERLWTRKVGDGVYGTPAIAEGGVCFVGCNDNRLYALDLTTGEVVWKERVGRDIRSSVALTADGTVVVASWDWSLYAFDGGAGGPATAPWPQFQGDAARTGRYAPDSSATSESAAAAD
jgi:outer membrane protein assembly factor BamB